jgi:hypothetical protein
MPVGILKRALRPTPSTRPDVLVPYAPAMVTASPVVGLMRRRALLPRSATMSQSLGVKRTIPHGALKRALVPVPSTNPLVPDVLPLSVVVAPVDTITRRTALLPQSATYSTPRAMSRARPTGELKRTVPDDDESTKPETPPPARVETTPEDVILRTLWLLFSTM